MKSVNQKTRDAYWRHWEIFQNWLIQTGRTLTTESIEHYVNDLIEHGKAPRTINAKLIAIRHFSPPDLTIPKLLKAPVTRSYVLNSEDLVRFHEGLKVLPADQKTEVLRWMRGQKTERTYASVLRYVKKVGYLTFAQNIKMGQIRGVLGDDVH